MSDVATVLLKGLAGGSLVVAFALLSEVVGPKRFAGLFGAAPAVAIAGLAIGVATKSAHHVREQSVGMLAGSAGLAVYAAVAVPLVRRASPLAASAASLLAWAAVAGAVAAPLLA